MNVQHLREFMAFQETMNISATARKLYISQPSLSNHIASLESELGVPLIKHDRELTLTPAGRMLVNEAPKLLAVHDGIILKCKEAAITGGTLRIARNHGTRSCCEDNFDILIAGFANVYPEVFISDIVWDESSSFDTLNNGDADLVSVNYMPPASDVEKGVVFVKTPNYVNGHYCLWVDEKNPLVSRESIQWTDVESLNVPISRNQNMITTNIKDLCFSLDIDLTVRQTPEFGWSYLRTFGEDDTLILDTGFEGYGTFKMFPTRRLLVLEGEGSEDRKSVV